MRGNTPPTTRSPPHRPRPAGNPPIRHPATAGKEKRGGRGPTSRRTPTRAAPERRPPLTARHAPPPRTGTSHPVACARPPHSDTRPAAGPARAPPPPPPALPPQPHTPRSPPTATGCRKGGCPVVSNRLLHRATQQRRHHASASARSPPRPPMPGPRLQRAAHRPARADSGPHCGTEFLCRLWRAELGYSVGRDQWDGKRAAGGMSGDHDRCFSILVLGGIFDRCFQHQCITPH